MGFPCGRIETWSWDKVFSIPILLWSCEAANETLGRRGCVVLVLRNWTVRLGMADGTGEDPRERARLTRAGSVPVDHSLPARTEEVPFPLLQSHRNIICQVCVLSFSESYCGNTYADLRGAEMSNRASLPSRSSWLREEQNIKLQDSAFLFR